MATQPEAPAAPDDLGLGERVTLAEARASAPFPLVEPRAPGRPPPDEVRFDPATAGGQVAFVWRGADGDPELLLTQFQAPLGHEYVAKFAGPATGVAAVDVNGSPGIWLEGAPHAFAYVGPDGEVREETLRLAGDTLLWERGELTLRLEGDLTRAEALRLARALGS